MDTIYGDVRTISANEKYADQLRLRVIQQCHDSFKQKCETKAYLILNM